MDFLSVLCSLSCSLSGEKHKAQEVNRHKLSVLKRDLETSVKCFITLDWYGNCSWLFWLDRYSIGKWLNSLMEEWLITLKHLNFTFDFGNFGEHGPQLPPHYLTALSVKLNLPKEVYSHIWWLLILKRWCAMSTLMVTTWLNAPFYVLIVSAVSNHQLLTSKV